MSLSLNKLQLALFAVYVVVMVDMFGTTLVIPVMALYAQFLGASEAQLGSLYSCSSAASIVSSFYVGWISDKFGRKNVFLYSSFGAVLAFLGSALSRNYTQLIISRTFAGLFTGTIGTAFAYVSDVVKPRDRVKYLSYMSAVMSTCFVVGPLIGGGLSVFSLRVPFYSAAGMAVAELFIVFFFIKEPSTFQDIIDNNASVPSSPVPPERVVVKYTESDKNNNGHYISDHSDLNQKQSDSALSTPLLEESSESENLLPTGEHSDSSNSSANNMSTRTWCQFIWLLFYIPPESPYRSFAAVGIGGVGTFLNTCGYMGLAVLIPLLMLQNSFGIVSEDGMYGLLQAIGMIYVYPRVQKRIGLYYTGAIGSILVATGMGSLVFVKSITDMIPIYIVLSIGNSLVRPIFPTHLSFVAPKGMNAEYIAVSNTFSNLGIMVAGQFTQLYAFNKASAFLLSALLSAILVVILVLYGIYQDRLLAKKNPKDTMTDLERFFDYGVEEKDFFLEFESALKSTLIKRHFNRALTSKKGHMLLLEIILDAIPDLPYQFDDRMLELKKLFVQYGHEDWALEMSEVLPSLEQIKRIDLGIPGRS